MHMVFITHPSKLVYMPLLTRIRCCLLCKINFSHAFDSSFNDKPVNESAFGPLGKELFEKEQDDLLSDLKDIPKKACDRRVSSLHAIFGSLDLSI